MWHWFQGVLKKENKKMNSGHNLSSEYCISPFATRSTHTSYKYPIDSGSHVSIFSLNKDNSTFGVHSLRLFYFIIQT